MTHIKAPLLSGTPSNPQAPSTEIQSLLSRAAEEFGITDICYYYDLVSPRPWFQNDPDWQTVFKRMQKRRNLFTTSKNALTLWQQHVRHYDSTQENVEAMFSQEKHLWRLSNSGNALKRAMGTRGYRHKLTLSLPCPLMKEATGRFTLLMKDDAELERVRSMLPTLKPRLEELQRTISLDYGREINPLVDYNIVSPVSAYILRLVASGESRDSMAAEMSLTLRGIDYHIANLKSTLEARNIANLVARGCQLRLI